MINRQMYCNRVQWKPDSGTALNEHGTGRCANHYNQASIICDYTTSNFNSNVKIGASGLTSGVLTPAELSTMKSDLETDFGEIS